MKAANKKKVSAFFRVCTYKNQELYIQVRSFVHTSLGFVITFVCDVITICTYTFDLYIQFVHTLGIFVHTN